MSYKGPLAITLVRSAHQRLSGAGVDLELDDLLQGTSMAVLAAARRFDPDRGVDLSSAYPSSRLISRLLQR